MAFIYDTEKLVNTLYCILEEFFKRHGIPLLLLDIFVCIFVIALVLGFISVNVMFLVWLERKVSAHIQVRLGPMRVGWHGCLQTIADAIKLLCKESIYPKAVDKKVFFIAPVIVFSSAVLAYVVIPWSPGVIVRDLNMGICYLLAVSGLSTIGILSAGWASNNKYSLLGGMRATAQIISYGVALGLSVIGVVMLASTLSMVGIVNAQEDLWFIFKCPLGFLIYILAGTAELNRAPFDIPEAESELVGGFHTEYSAMKFAMFFLAEYAAMFVVAATAAVLFLGGWNGLPFIGSLGIPPILWFLAKTYLIVFFFMWIRWTYPRLKVNQLMEFGWKFLIPLGFLNIFITGLICLI